ncbi:MAG: insulinase family protein [Deltaproteobacteria bacterium]|nr:insulinase family protein [Deltaproteobacteria bacterium]
MYGALEEERMKQSGKTQVRAWFHGHCHGKVLAGTLAMLFAGLAGESACAVLDKGMTEHLLDNGLTVVVVEDHWHPLVALEVCYRVGARNDPPGKQGLSHLLEHLTFRGRGAPPAESTDRAERSGRAHATTNHDTTCYSSSIIRDDLNAMLESEAERMKQLDISSEDLEREKTIVTRERSQLVAGDTWRNFLEEVDTTAYRLHPYRFPTLGWPETLAQITLDDIHAHFATYYTPANAVVVVVGDAKRQDLVAAIQEFFGSAPTRTHPAPPRFVEPAQSGERRLLMAPYAAPRLVAAYHTPPFSSPDRAALEVVTEVLAGSSNARLPALMYAQDIAEDIGVEYDPYVLDPGLFYIKVAMGPRIDFPRTGEAVDDVLWHLREDGLTPAELNTAKKRLLLDFYLDRGLRARATRLAQYVMLKALSQAQHYTDEIQAVTTADVQRVITTYCAPDTRVVAVTGMAHQEQERRHTGVQP